MEIMIMISTHLEDRKAKKHAIIVRNTSYSV